MPMIVKEIEINIDLDEFSDKELIEELTNRDYKCVGYIEGAWITLEQLYELKRRNNPEFDTAFSKYCYQQIGRII